MTSSSLMVAQIVSSTGMLIQDFIPFGYLILAGLIVIICLTIFYRQFKSGFKKAF